MSQCPSCGGDCGRSNGVCFYGSAKSSEKVDPGKTRTQLEIENVMLLDHLQRAEACRDDFFDSSQKWHELVLTHCNTIVNLSKRIRSLEVNLLQERLKGRKNRVGDDVPFQEHWREE